MGSVPVFSFKSRYLGNLQQQVNVFRILLVGKTVLGYMIYQISMANEILRKALKSDSKMRKKGE